MIADRTPTGRRAAAGCATLTTATSLKPVLGAAGVTCLAGELALGAAPVAVTRLHLGSSFIPVAAGPFHS